MVKIYLFCAVLLSTCLNCGMTLQGAQSERRRVSPSSLTMEDRKRRLVHYGDLLESYEKALVKKAKKIEEDVAGIDLQEKEKLQENERTLAKIEKSLQTVHATQYQILVATHQISIIAHDNERLYMVAERRFNGTWKEVRLSPEEKNAIIQQEKDFIAGYVKFDTRVLRACKKVKEKLVALYSNASLQRVEKKE